MSEATLTTAEAEKVLNIPAYAIRYLIKSEVLSGSKVQGRWQITRTSIEHLKTILPKVEIKPLVPKDTGILQLTVGLTGVSAVIMTLLPTSVASTAPISKIIIFFISLVVALLSLIASLMMLAQHLENASLLDLGRFETLPHDLGYIVALFASSPLPYRLLAISLFLLVIGLLLATFFILAFG